MNALNATITKSPVLYEVFQKTPGKDKFKNDVRLMIFFKYIQDSHYYSEIYDRHANSDLKHDSHSLMVKELIQKMGYKYFIKAFDKVIKLEYEGKTENFPKGIKN